MVLLIALTTSSPDIQKLVAFENAFDRIFAIMQAEGSLSHGGVVVQDCLSLLANLLRLNTSNQAFFRETGGVMRLAAVLAAALEEEDAVDGIPKWATSQRDKNLWGLLAVIRLFVADRSLGTEASQATFWQNAVTLQVLDVAFHTSMDVMIRSEVSQTVLILH